MVYVENDRSAQTTLYTKHRPISNCCQLANLSEECCRSGTKIPQVWQTWAECQVSEGARQHSWVTTPGPCESAPADLQASILKTVTIVRPVIQQGKARVQNKERKKWFDKSAVLVTHHLENTKYSLWRQGGPLLPIARMQTMISYQRNNREN